MMQLYLAMALYGSGTQSPVGIFESEELAKEAIFELGNPTGYSITPMRINQNWEKWARLERDKYQDFLDQTVNGYFVKKGQYGTTLHIMKNEEVTLCWNTLGKKWREVSGPQKIRDVCNLCLKERGYPEY